MSYEIVQKGSDVAREQENYASRQQHRRLNVRVPIRISSIDPETDPDSGKPFFVMSEEVSSNISGGGVCVACSDAMTPGRRVLVEIDIPTGETVQSIAQVVWKRPGIVGSTTTPGERPGFGLRFDASGTIALAPLDRFISRAMARRNVPRAGVTPTPR